MQLIAQEIYGREKMNNFSGRLNDFELINIFVLKAVPRKVVRHRHHKLGMYRRKTRRVK